MLQPGGAVSCIGLNRASLFCSVYLHFLSFCISVIIKVEAIQPLFSEFKTISDTL